MPYPLTVPIAINKNKSVFSWMPFCFLSSLDATWYYSEISPATVCHLCFVILLYSSPCVKDLSCWFWFLLLIPLRSPPWHQGVLGQTQYPMKKKPCNISEPFNTVTVFHAFDTQQQDLLPPFCTPLPTLFYHKVFSSFDLDVFQIRTKVPPSHGLCGCLGISLALSGRYTGGKPLGNWVSLH